MKLLIFGIDGGDLSILEAMDMPFFKSLLSESHSEHLEEELYNRGWAEILTGKEGKETRGFYMSPKLDGSHILKTSFKMKDLEEDLDIISLWEICETSHVSFCIMNVPTTTPAPKVANGVIIGSSGGGLNEVSGVPDILVSDSETRRFLEQKKYVVDFRRGVSTLSKTVDFIEQLNQMQHKQAECFADLCMEKDVDLGFLATRSTTEVQYLARNEIQEIIDHGGPRTEIQKTVFNHYKKLDDDIKYVFNKLKPQDFIITSDHNIVQCRFYGNTHPFLIDNGFMTMKTFESFKTKLVANAKCLAKKVLGYKNIKSPYLTYELFQDIDWTKTLAFGHGFVSGIFINDKKRFNGPVEEVDIMPLVDKICKTYNQLPEATRAGSIATKYRSKHKGAKFSDCLPDIFIDNSEHIYFDNKGSSLIRENENYKKISESLKDVANPPVLTGTKGKNPLFVLSKGLVRFIEKNDKKNLTLVYKVTERLLNQNKVK